MTHRRDKGLSHDGCIKGLRMEKDLAQRFSDAARENAEGDAAEMARYLIRRGLGASHVEANRREEQMRPDTLVVRGLKTEADIGTRLDGYIARVGLASRAAGARHLIRLGLGYKTAESMKLEAGFAAIAAARQGLHGVFHGAEE